MLRQIKWRASKCIRTSTAKLVLLGCLCSWIYDFMWNWILKRMHKHDIDKPVFEWEQTRYSVTAYYMQTYRMTCGNDPPLFKWLMSSELPACLKYWEIIHLPKALTEQDGNPNTFQHIDSNSTSHLPPVSASTSLQVSTYNWTQHHMRSSMEALSANLCARLWR